MLSFLLVGFTLTFGQITYPLINQRFTVPVDTCIDGITKTGTTYDDSGSMKCHCSDASVQCYYYEDAGCTGILQATDIWGGCDQTGTTKYIYTVEGCEDAQIAAQSSCPYYVASFTSSTNLYSILNPVNQCIDYNCDGDNNSPTSRSCKYSCSGTTVTANYYSDYYCETFDNVQNFTVSDTQDCSGTTPCGVTVTRYSLSSNTYGCGSKKSPFDTSSKKSGSNYMLTDIDTIPIPLDGACMENRFGYYSYSYKYKCNDDKNGVELWHYLGNANCAGSNAYLVRNYSNVNATIVCNKGSGEGKIGYYDSCSEYNWDAYYFESPILFGQCVQFKVDEEETQNDGSLPQDQPWYKGLSVVHSCNLNKDYPAVYFYTNTDCSGEYLFRWDYTSYYSLKGTYGNKKCAYPQISNCGNTKDTTTNKDVPTGYSTCSGVIRIEPVIGLILGFIAMLF